MGDSLTRRRIRTRDAKAIIFLLFTIALWRSSLLLQGSISIHFQTEVSVGMTKDFQMPQHFDTAHFRFTNASPSFMNPSKKDSRISSGENPIFYNVFINASEWNFTKTKKILRGNSMRIVQKQLDEIAKAAEVSKTLPTVRYVLIGANRRTYTLFQHICNKRLLAVNNGTMSDEPCLEQAFLHRGNEKDTLQSLYEYCQDHPQEVVTYIHNKGSYNRGKNNEYARRLGTKAALDCRQFLLQTETKSGHHDRCNICSFSFQVMPQYQGRANMWTANCTYIRNLHPPKTYERTMQSMYDTILRNISANKINQQDLSCPKNKLGIGRYAYERWGFSHPHVVPCDIVPISNRRKAQISGDWTPEIVHGPQDALRTRRRGRQSLSAWDSLEGRLFEWDYVYGQKCNNRTSGMDDKAHIPPASSWIWKYYPNSTSRNGSIKFLEECFQSDERRASSQL